MKPITLHTCKLFIVDAIDFKPATKFKIVACLTCFTGNNRWVTDIGLPSGNWQILGRLNETTDDQAKGIVEFRFGNQSEMLEPGYINYNPSRNGWGEKYIQNFDTALESFHSLMQANGVTGDELILIEN